ncbi:redoxin domain-containing protein [Rhizomonospora bruguierae]|uniref:redoxin domain-containing protein n=1 Tax=Rhizomonospora bruguierae TaxID=1581705 RepID=UPI001BCC7E82|nr:redoxin domain-containing protein [Micromonospora sp. NBRC 107566]
MTDGNAMPMPGERAPDFALPTFPDQRVGLADYRGRPVVLAFYPADWSPVCGDQMSLYQAVSPVFAQYDAALLGISVDGIWSHRAFAQQRNIDYPLLSDFEPKGEVSREYGVYSPVDGVAERSLFLIDSDGTIAWSFLSPRGVNPGADGILAALDALENGRVVVRR